MQDRGPHETVVDVPDPDGTVLRFVWERETEQGQRFAGLCFDTAGPPEFYDVPRLPIPANEQTRLATGQPVTAGMGLAQPGHTPSLEYQCGSGPGPATRTSIPVDPVPGAGKTWGMHAVVATVRIRDLEVARQALAGPGLNVVPRAPGSYRNRPTCRRSAAFRCLSTSSSASFAISLRNSSAARPSARHVSIYTSLISTRPANHHLALAADEGTGQPHNRLFERHRHAGQPSRTVVIRTRVIRGSAGDLCPCPSSASRVNPVIRGRMHSR